MVTAQPSESAIESGLLDREAWIEPGKVLETLIGIIGSIGQALDVWQVLFGDKPVSRVILQQARMKPVALYAAHLGISHAQAAYSLHLVQSQTGYADNAVIENPWQGIIAPQNNTPQQRKMALLYIAKNLPDAEACRSAEESGNDAELGVRLGYPACCAKAFAKWSAVSKDKDFTLHGIPEVAAALPWQNNIALRHVDTRLSAHFPCSATCPSSLRVNQKYFDTIYRHNPELAAILRTRLASTVLYHKKYGPYVLCNPVKKGSMWFIDGAQGYGSNSFYEQLRRQGKFKEGEDALVLCYR